MKEAIVFLRKRGRVAFATVDLENKPRVRTMEIMKVSDTHLWFATSPNKEVYSQLLTNPNVELLAMDGDISVRVSGKVEFDVTDSLGKDIYETNPVLQRLYKDHKELVYFSLQMNTVEYCDIAPTPPIYQMYTIKCKI